MIHGFFRWWDFCLLLFFVPMESEGARLVKPLMDALKFGGLWFDFGDSKRGEALKWFNVFRGTFAFLVVVTQFAFLGIKGASYLLNETSVFIPIDLDENAMALAIMYNLGSVRSTVDMYERTFDYYSKIPWAKRIILEEFNVYGKIFQFLSGGLLGFLLFYVVVPLAFDGVRAFMGIEEPYVVPLPFNFLLDDPPRRTLFFYATLLTSHLYLMVIVPRFIAFQALIIYFVAFVVVDMKILIQKMRHLEEADDGTLLLQRDWELRDIVNHHSKIVEVVHRRNKFIGFALILQNLLMSVSCCLVLYLIKTSLRNGDFVLASFCAVFEVWMVMMNLTCNGAGLVVESQSERLFEEMCDIKWYKQPPRVRKTLIMMTCQSKQLLNLSYRGSVVNLQASLQVMNKAYSFFTLISSME